MKFHTRFFVFYLITDVRIRGKVFLMGCELLEMYLIQKVLT